MAPHGGERRREDPQIVGVADPCARGDDGAAARSHTVYGDHRSLLAPLVLREREMEPVRQVRDIRRREVGGKALRIGPNSHSGVRIQSELLRGLLDEPVNPL